MAKSGRHFSLAVLPAVCFSVLQVICSSLGSCIHLSEKQDLSQQCTLWLFRYLGSFLGKKVSGKVWCGVGIAVAGLYLLCMTESGFSVQKGDFLLMLCALAFSLHILVIDYFSPKADGVKLSCIQFFTCGILSGVGMVLTEKPQLTSILAAWMPILYAGVMSCGVAYTADHRAERNESDGCIVNFEPGISGFSNCRIPYPASDAFSQGTDWLCINVCGDHSGTAS